MASPAHWQLRTTHDMAASPLTPVPSGSALLRLASLPPSSAVWVGTVMSEREAAATVAAMVVPLGSQAAVAVARFIDSPTPPLTCGSAGARRSASGGAATASLGDAILLFGDQRPLRPPGAPADASGDDALHLWALRAFVGEAPPSAVRVAARPAAGGGAPSRRQFAAAACCGGRLYVVGGARPGAERGAFDAEPPPGAALWDAWVFTPDDAARPEAGGAWAQLPLRGAEPTGDPPGLRSAAAVLLSADDPAAARLLLFGGWTNGGLSSDVLAVRLATGDVARLGAPTDDAEPRPSARAHAAATLLPGGGRVLLTGGGSEFADAADAAWLFDVQRCAWSPVALADAEFRQPQPERMFGRMVFGQHTLVMTLPRSARDAADDAASLLVWGGQFRAVPPGAAPEQACTVLLGQMRQMRLERETEQKYTVMKR